MMFNFTGSYQTLEELKENITYDYNTGGFYWKTVKSHRKLNKPIGCKSDRYYVVTFNQIKYLLHKLAWYFYYDEYPDFQIDHINQDTHDNRITNLRKTTDKDNSRNKPKRRDNKTGVTGVYFESYTKKYRANIIDNDGKCIRKRFTTLDEAKSWRDSKAIEFGYSENHGRELSRLPYREK